MKKQMCLIGVLAWLMLPAIGGGAVLFSDDFERADADTLGANWVETATFGIRSGNAANVFTTGSWYEYATVNGFTMTSGTTYTMSTTMFIQHKSQFAGVVWCYQDADNTYLLRFNQEGTVQFFRYDVGVSALLVNTTHGFTIPDNSEIPVLVEVEFDDSGNFEITLTQTVSGRVKTITYVDATPLTSGSCGITGWPPGAASRYQWLDFTIFDLNVEDPVFTPDSGTPITGPTAVSISCATAGASIYYTTDGSTPSDTNGTLYTVAVTINPGDTLKAIALKSGYSSSAVISQTYFAPSLAAPFHDDFERADADMLGVNWVETAPFGVRSGNAVNLFTTGTWYKYATVNGFTMIPGTTYTMSTTMFIRYKSQFAGVVWCYEDLDNTYLLRYNQEGTVQIFRYDGGVSTLLVNTNNGFTIPNDSEVPVTIEVEFDDSGNFSVIMTQTQSGNVKTITYADATPLTSGSCGITGWPPGATARYQWLNFTIFDPNGVRDPVFTPDSGTYITGPTGIIMTCPTSGASIYYTTDGSTPSDTNGTLYTAAVTVNPGDTLKAIALKSGYNDSAVVAHTYLYPPVAAPMFDTGKYISGPASVAISCETAGSTIYYTTDGTEPTTGSTLYSGAVSVSDGTTLKAIAVATNHPNSSVTSVSYVVPTYNRPAKIFPGTAVVDGDLSDWPVLSAATEYDSGDPDNKDRVWVPLDQDYYGTPTDISSAYYAVRWSADKIYVAIIVEDTSHLFSIEAGSVPTGMWDDQDTAGVHIHTAGIGPVNYSATQADAQQYTFGPSGSDSSVIWSCLGDALLIPAYANYSAACSEDGLYIYYEVAVTPFQQFDLNDSGNVIASVLEAGDVIGLDVAASTFDSANAGGIKTENLLGGDPDWSKFKDYEMFGRHLLADDNIPGDANGDGAVDVGDLGILAANYGTTSGATWATGDFNGDGAVDVGDLGILAANYGTGSSSSNFDADYAEVFGGAAYDDAEEDSSSTLCGALGLPLIVGLALMGLMLVKLEEQEV